MTRMLPRPLFREHTGTHNNMLRGDDQKRRWEEDYVRQEETETDSEDLAFAGDDGQLRTAFQQVRGKQHVFKWLRV